MKTVIVAGLLLICSVVTAAQQSYPYDVVATGRAAERGGRGRS
jgi:hypothetical protein